MGQKFITTIACAFALTAAAAAAPAAYADTIEIDAPEQALQGQPVEIGLDGEADAPRRLFAFLQPDGPCAPTAHDAAFTPKAQSVFGDLLSGVAVTDDWDETATVTPTSPGAYVICAYTADSAQTEPKATEKAELAVSAPTATLNATTGKALANTPLSISVTGNTDTQTLLFSYLMDDDTPCAASAAEEGEDAIQIGAPRAVTGAISHTFNATPEEAGTYWVCLYLADNAAATPRATVAQKLTVNQPGATIALGALPPSIKQGDAFTITASGTTDADAFTTTEFIEGDEPCRGEEFEDTVPAPAGPFTISETPVVDFTGPATVCVYVLDEEDTILASARGNLRVEKTAKTQNGSNDKGDATTTTDSAKKTRKPLNVKQAKRLMRKLIKKRAKTKKIALKRCKQTGYRLTCKVKTKGFGGKVTAFSDATDKLHGRYKAKRRR